MPPASACHATEAAKWYRLAAEQGRSNAQFNLGRMHATGEGVPLNMAEAAKWWRAAADQGHAAVQYNLGLAYSRGQGVPADQGKAVRWWRAAAAQNNTAAQYNLAVALFYGRGVFHGRGVDRDAAEALRLYRLAAAKNYTVAQVNLASMYDKGTRCPSKPCPRVHVVQPGGIEGRQAGLQKPGSPRQAHDHGPDSRGVENDARAEASGAGGPITVPACSLLYRGGVSLRQDCGCERQSSQNQPHLVQPPRTNESAITPEKIVSRFSIVGLTQPRLYRTVKPLTTG